MNIEILEKALLPFFLAVLVMVAFNSQFTHSYSFILEHFKDAKLSIQIAHLFVYSFLVLGIFLFLINTLNLFVKSKVFITTTVVTLFTFYLLSYESLITNINYFIHYPLSTNTIMFMILFVVSVIVYALYSLLMPFFNNGQLPFLHSLTFLLIAVIYSAWFIHEHGYKLSTLYEKYSQLGLST